MGGGYRLLLELPPWPPLLAVASTSLPCRLLSETRVAVVFSLVPQDPHFCPRIQLSLYFPFWPGSFSGEFAFIPLRALGSPLIDPCCLS